jgi:hypothetical protein
LQSFFFFHGYNAIWHPGIAKASDGKNPNCLFCLLVSQLILIKGKTLEQLPCIYLVYLLSYTGHAAPASKSEGGCTWVCQEANLKERWEKDLLFVFLFNYL